MTHLRPINQKAARIAQGMEEARRRAAAGNGGSAGEDGRVVALQDSPAQPPKQEGPHIPLGCSFIFLPGWEGGQQRRRGGACASRSSATCSTATSAASGPRRCRIS